MFRTSGTSDRNVRDVVSENTELKKFHEQIRREVRTILSRHEGILGRGFLEDSSGVNKRGGVRARPTRLADAGFTGSLKKQWNSLKQVFEVLEARASRSEESHLISVTDHEKELARLKKEVQELREELAQSRELISQQQQLLQDQMLPSPGVGQQSPLWDAYFLEEQLRLQEEREVFEEQKLAFQDEREKFTEAAIRLGRERLQFKADQALFMKQQFLNLTPGDATPPWKKTPPWSAFSAGTPTRPYSNCKKQCSPAMSCGHKMGLTSADPMTPSTAELYRVLRLAPPNRFIAREIKGPSRLILPQTKRQLSQMPPRHQLPETQPRGCMLVSVAHVGAITASSAETRSLSFAASSSKRRSKEHTLLSRRSVMPHKCHSSSQRGSESDEGSSEGWTDSLSPSSASPELHQHPNSYTPIKLSMTPYLQPRPSPMSSHPSHMDPQTPCSAELFRVLRLTPAESAHSGRRSRGDTLWRSVVHHSHRRASLSKTTESPCCHETVKYNESVSRCPHEATGDCYETDSEDMGHAMDQGETPTNDTHSLPREDYECFDNDSLYRVSPLQETSHLEPHLGGSHYCSHSKGVWPCEELGEQRSSNGIRTNGIQKSKPKETLQPKDRCTSQSCETLQPRDQRRSQSRDTLHPRDACRSRSAERGNSSSTTECRSRSRERTHSRERYRTRSKEDIQRRNSLCHLPRPVIHIEDECQNGVPHHHSSMNRRRSLESLHHKHSQAREALYVTGICSSRSMHRRSSQHRRDSLYTSGPGRSPLHFRQSCPSARNSNPWPSEEVAASNLYGDLMTQFMDCSY
ncbi:PREDICTED: uncharacterized protein LOC108794962 [Nanorana parkeri]|uniref:uncharacterized protein LOC108794962 n=1 Tax=Nanorana parkeri TaxID=125878 RepID=UPI0008546ED7|nr:PREDICTED: uncharacterized protein LOC108794962 [Nanorana parkeri]